LASGEKISAVGPDYQKGGEGGERNDAHLLNWRGGGQVDFAGLRREKGERGGLVLSDEKEGGYNAPRAGASSRWEGRGEIALPILQERKRKRGVEVIGGRPAHLSEKKKKGEKRREKKGGPVRPGGGGGGGGGGWGGGGGGGGRKKNEPPARPSRRGSSEEEGKARY